MSDTSSTTGSARFAEHNVVATYPSPDEARAALSILERHGVEAGDIELYGPGMRSAGVPVTNEEQREADVDLANDIGKRSALGIVVAVVVLGGIGAGLGAVIAGDLTGIVVGAIAGAFAGVALGFFYGGSTGLTVNEQFGETFQSEGGETSVAVHSDDRDEIDAAVEALRGTDAKRLATCGRDGQLRDIA